MLWFFSNIVPQLRTKCSHSSHRYIVNVIYFNKLRRYYNNIIKNVYICVRFLLFLFLLFVYFFIPSFILLIYNILILILCVDCEHLVWSSGTLCRNIMYIKCGEREHLTLFQLLFILQALFISLFLFCKILHINTWIFKSLDTCIYEYMYIRLCKYANMKVLACVDTYIYSNIAVYTHICKYL